MKQLHSYETSETTVMSIVAGSGDCLELMHIELEIYMPSAGFTLYPMQDTWCFL